MSSVARDDPRHEPDPQRLLRTDRVADQRHLRGTRRSDETGQEPRRAAVRHEPDPPECQDEAGVVRGDPEVAREGERRAGALPRPR